MNKSRSDTRKYSPSGQVRIVAAILLVAAVLGGLSALADDEIYFTGVNDKVLPLNDETMPYVWNDKYYVPYTVFDTSLGIYSSYNREDYTLTFWNRENVLTFDFLKTVAYDGTKQYSERGVWKNDTIYVPAEFICERFGLYFEHINAPAATILRIVSESSLDSIAFREWVGADLLKYYREYTGYYSPSPGTAQSPTPTPSTNTEPEIKVVYLTFNGGSGDYAADILDVLDEYEMKVTFFMTRGEIMARPDLVRRIAGSEHGLALRSCAEEEPDIYSSAQALTDAIEAANAALFEIAGFKTRIFRFSEGSEHSAVTREYRDAVTGAGYRYWDPTERTDATSFGSATSADLSSRVTRGLRNTSNPGVVVLMDDSELTASALSTILRFIQNNNYVVRVITQSEAPINSFGEM